MSAAGVYTIVGLLLLILVSLVYLVSLAKKDASIIDPIWSLLFLVASGFAYFANDAPNRRSHLLLTLVVVWSLRLAIYLVWRSRGEPEDFRYRAFREAAGPSWWWRSYFKVFVLQAVLAWVIAAPLVLGLFKTGPDLNFGDSLGLIFWLVGFGFEVFGDWQLARFRKDPSSRGKVLDTGVWRYTRHPNYFGEATLWWGFYLLAGPAGGPWMIFSPILMTVLLLKVSGVVLLEKTLVDTKPQYADYIRRTPAFVPWYPKKPENE